MTLIEKARDYPGTTGFISTILSTGSGMTAWLTSEQTVRLITCLGAILGVVLTVMSIYHKWLMIRKDSR